MRTHRTHARISELVALAKGVFTEAAFVTQKSGLWTLRRYHVPLNVASHI